ncbi:hypothetical protein [Salinispora pacifica]|uniref:hypothetical protein n=1 Tax=Salinispora pacifica TaxID=351187 RepID=UPI000484AAD4|nr:hypothetical protein [Salinispora pacifica]
MTTPAHRLPIHGECHHDHDVATITVERDAALDRLAEVWAALGRAGCHSPLATAAELIDQLAAQRHRARATLADARDLITTLDDVVSQLDAVQARYATRPGSPAGGAQDAAKPAESHAQARIGPGWDRGTTYPPIDMQQFLDYSTAEFAAARTDDERVEVIRDLLEGWHDRWDAYYATAVTDEYAGIARHLVTLIAAAEAHAADREG